MPASLAVSLPFGDVITVTLDGPPVAKGRPRGRIVMPRSKAPFIHWYTPAETVAYEKALAWAGKVAMRGRKPLDGALCVTVTAYMPVPASWSGVKRAKAYAGEILPTTKPDRDNIEKCVGDALNGIVWVDDCQIVDGPVRKLYGDPRLVVEVMEL